MTRQLSSTKGGGPLSENGDDFQTAVAYGKDYLIVWSVVGASGDSDIFAARVSPSGSLLDAAPHTPVATTSAEERHPAVASDGTDFLLVWEIDVPSGGPGSQLTKYARIDASGTLLDPGGIVLDGTVRGSPDVHFGGNHYLAAWTSSTGTLLARRIAAAGAMLDAAPIIVAVDPSGALDDPVVASNGTDFLIAWIKGDNLTGAGVGAARIDASGNVLDNPPLDLLSLLTPYADIAVNVASNGTDYYAAWSNGDTGGDLEGARITAAGALEPKTILSRRANTQENAVIRADGSEYFVSWRDDGESTSNIGIQRLASDGSVLANGLVKPHANRQGDPHMVQGAGIHLLVWAESADAGAQTDILGMRIGSTGQLLDTTPLEIAVGVSDEMPTSLAFDGNNFLLLYLDFGTAPDPVSAEIRSLRIDSLGDVIDTKPTVIDTIPSELAFGLSPELVAAHGGKGFFAMWPKFSAPDTLTLYGSRISDSNVVLDSPAKEISTVPGIVTTLDDSMSVVEGMLALTAAPEGYFAIWSVEDASGWKVRGRRLSQQALLLDSVDKDLGSGSSVSAIFDGYYHDVVTGTLDGELSLRRIARDGSGGSPQAIGNRLGIFPSVATDGKSTIVAAYERQAAPPIGRDRVYSSMLTWLPNGDVCATADACFSGQCVLSICCENECVAGDCSTGICVPIVADASVDVAPISDAKDPRIDTSLDTFYVEDAPGNTFDAVVTDSVPVAPPDPPDTSGCGCQANSTQGPLAGLGACLFLILLLANRRRSRF